MSHRKITDGLRITATYEGVDQHGHYMLKDVTGDLTRDHVWLNGERSNFPGPEYPDGIREGSRIRFFACLFPRMGGARLTDVRQLEVLA
jgi:hypothetical protein